MQTEIVWRDPEGEALDAVASWVASVLDEDAQELHVEQIRKALIVPCEGEVVYLVLMPGTALKVGRTSNMARRLHDLQTGNPVDLVLLGSVPAGTKPGNVERFLLSRMKPWRMRGEWYELHPAAITTALCIMRMMAKLATGLAEEHYEQVCDAVGVGPRGSGSGWARWHEENGSRVGRPT